MQVLGPKKMNVNETYVLNFFFDRLCEENLIKFEYEFDNIFVNGNKLKIFCKLVNSKEQLEAEKQFFDFNSISNKQEVGHNFKAAVNTGQLITIYPDFIPAQTREIDTAINDFIQYEISYILTFFQRRRVILGMVKVEPSAKFVRSFGLYCKGELIDSVSYGEPLISYIDTQNGLNIAVNHIAILSKKERDIVLMLLLRYNETLNLPYSYERIESYWRILESLSDSTMVSSSEILEYERLKTFIGIKNNSKALKIIIKTLIAYQISYTDEEIRDSFEYRNLCMHEYLNRELTTKSYLADIFSFLNKAVELIILSNLGISYSFYKDSKYSIIMNRVL
jgi:hypothetical protein